MASQREWISNIPPEILARFQSATIIGDSIPKKERKESANPLPPLAVDPDNRLAMGIELAQFRDGDTWEIVKFFARNQDSRLLLNEISIAIKQRNATHTTHIEDKIGYLNYALTRDRKRSYITKGDDGRFSLSTPVEIKDLREELAKQQKAKTEKLKGKTKKPTEEAFKAGPPRISAAEMPAIKHNPTEISENPKLCIDEAEDPNFRILRTKKGNRIIRQSDPMSPEESDIIAFLLSRRMRVDLETMYSSSKLHRNDITYKTQKQYEEWVKQINPKIEPLGLRIDTEEEEKRDVFVLKRIQNAHAETATNSS